MLSLPWMTKYAIDNFYCYRNSQGPMGIRTATYGGLVVPGHYCVLLVKIASEIELILAMTLEKAGFKRLPGAILFLL